MALKELINNPEAFERVLQAVKQSQDNETPQQKEWRRKEQLKSKASKPKKT